MSFKTKKQEVINFSKRNWKAITGALLLGVGSAVVIAKINKDRKEDNTIIYSTDSGYMVVDGDALNKTMEQDSYESKWDDRLVQLKTRDYDRAKEVLLENGISLNREEDYGKYVTYEVEDNGETEVTKEDLELEDKPEDDAE